MQTRRLCGSADLSRRLRAAAVGGAYLEGLSDDEDEDDGDDAEISDLEEALETQQRAAPADNHMQNSLHQEQEGGLDSMNSSAQQPWGAEVRTSPLLLCGLLAAASMMAHGHIAPTQHVACCDLHYLPCTQHELVLLPDKWWYTRVSQMICCAVLATPSAHHWLVKLGLLFWLAKSECGIPDTKQITA